MPIQLTVNGITFNYPGPGEDPDWSQGASDWAEEVTGVLNTLFNAGDITFASVTIANNQAIAANINSLQFDGSQVRGADVYYTIYRTSSTITTPKAEKGHMQISFDGASWSLVRSATEDTGVDITITNGGQLQYTSTNVGATSYSGKMSFYAKSLVV